ncbi:hypothetical protein ABGB07_32135 [Micromonosporaceae bacterium B7E4]
MEETARFRFDLILRVLGWGTVVYFLITGFALNQHEMFELRPAPGADSLRRAQETQADLLERRGDELQATDPVAAADSRVQAAKIELEVGNALREQSDNRGRAIALLVGVSAYAITYPLMILAMYRRTDPDGSLAARDLIPRRVAVGYGIVMSVVTTLVAAGTAYQ